MPELDLKKLRGKAKGQLALFLLDEIGETGGAILDLMHVLELPEGNRTHMYGILRGSKVLRHGSACTGQTFRCACLEDNCPLP